jgi:iron complex outermembrane receptor protein
MRLNTLLATSVAITAIAGAAQAQVSSNEPQATVVDEIMVTARKREERLFDVPVAVTAVTAETLENRQFQTVREIAAITPGLNINSDSAARGFISIRGVGVTLLDNVQPGVGIFVDGIYQANTSYLNSPTLAVQQIEVLRGPQSTLFGQNTLGGAINITTKQPTNDVEGSINAAYAPEDNFYTLGASISGPLIEDVLLGRLSVGTQGRDGFVENSLLGFDDANRLQQDTIRGALRWNLPNASTLTVNAYYDTIEGALPLYAVTTGPTDYVSDAQTNVRSHAEYEYTGINAKFETALNDTTDMTIIVAHDRRDQVGSTDGDYQPIELALSNSSSELRTSTAEVRFDTAWSDTFSTLVGAFVSRQETHQEALTTLVIVDPPIRTLAISDVEANLWAVFGTAFWNFAPDWELSLGLRFDHQEVTSVSAITATYEADEVQPRLALRRSFGDDSMVYGSVARGFRGGGANGPGAPNPLWDGDSVWTYELGAKTRLFDRRLTLTGAVFFNDYSDMIGQNSLAPSTTGAGIVGINLNTGDAESIGVEAEFTARLTDAWTLSGGLLIQRARITDDSRYVDTTGRQLASDRIPFEPDWTANLQTSYVMPIGPGDLTLSGGVIGKGDRMGSSLSETYAPELESYWLANMSVSYKWDAYEISVFANNLFDEEYYESFIDSSVLSVAGLPALGSLGLIGDGRRVGVRFGYSF